MLLHFGFLSGMFRTLLFVACLGANGLRVKKIAYTHYRGYWLVYFVLLSI